MNDSDHRRSRRRRDRGEFSAAMDRLEKAVSDVVDATTDELSGRARTLLDDAGKRVEAELRLRRMSGDSPEDRMDNRRRRRRLRERHRHDERRARWMRRSTRLYKVSSEAKIAGVCAGFAHYFGVDNWVVRMIALTGLIFLPGIVFPAYWIAFFIMDNEPQRASDEDESYEADVDEEYEEFHDERAGARERRRERKSRRQRRRERARAAAAGPKAPEELPPSRLLRRTVTDFTQAELRLRRLESFVTSDRYELQKELNKIDDAAGRAQPGGRPA